MHRAGDLPSAEAGYRQLLQRAADDERLENRALGLLGACLAQAGRTPEAIPLLVHAAQRSPDLANLANLGSALQQDGRHEEALQYLERALAIAPGNPDLLVNRAHALRALGRLLPALASCEEALRVEPRRPAAWLTCADLQHRLGRDAEALRSCARSIALAPGLAQGYYNQGVILQETGRWDEAHASLLAAVARDPAHADACLNLGLVCKALERPAEALGWLDRAIGLRDGAAARVARGKLHQAAQRYAAAEADFARALALGWADPGVHYLHADALRNLRQYAAAIASYDLALDLDPDHADAAKAHMNKGCCLLLLGQLPAGWPELEWRWADPRIMPPHRHGIERLWLGGSDLAGRTILVHAEQGYGDTLHLCRYIPELARSGARVMLEVRPALQSLLGRLDGCSAIVSPDEPVPPFDLHIPVFSLPLAMVTQLATIPARVPYLSAPEDRIAAWATRLGAPEGPRVGLAWAGNPRYPNDARRSIALERFATFLARPRAAPIEWISLQRDLPAGDEARLAQLPLRRFEAELPDFLETAALLMHLDLVICVDTATAHLAGALGRPFWVLLPLDPDWRWLLEREDSPWYPTARLLRQGEDGDWGGVLDRLDHAIDEWLAERMRD